MPQENLHASAQAPSTMLHTNRRTYTYTQNACFI